MWLDLLSLVMLELMAIFILGKAIQGLVEPKGLSPLKYVIVMLVLWASLEYVGVILGAKIFDRVIYVYTFGLAFGAIGGIIGYQYARLAKPVDETENDEQ